MITTGPTEPACTGPGWGARCWAATASPSTLPPAAINATPVTIAAIRLIFRAARAGRWTDLRFGISPAGLSGWRPS